MLVLHRDTDIYPKLTTVLVYPGAYIAKSVPLIGTAVGLEGQDVRLGESCTNGIVVLSWDDVIGGPWLAEDGKNLVLHEFAHQLDWRTARWTALRPLIRRASTTPLVHVAENEYDRLSATSGPGGLQRFLTDTAQPIPPSSSLSPPSASSRSPGHQKTTSGTLRRIEVLLSPGSRQASGDLSAFAGWAAPAVVTGLCHADSILSNQQRACSGEKYNEAAAALPGFKPGKPDEIARRIQAGDLDPRAMFYATENDEIVGYAVFGPNGRIS